MLIKISAKLLYFEMTCLCRSSHQLCSVRKGVLRNVAKFTGKRLCQSLFLIKLLALARVFSCEFCETSKNTFFYRTPPVTVSVCVSVELIRYSS